MGVTLAHKARWWEDVRFEVDPFPPRRILKGTGYYLKRRLGRRSYAEPVIARFERSSGFDGWAADSTDLGDEIRLVSLGDLLWMPEPVGRYLSPEIAGWLAGADAVLLNLETPIDPSAKHRAGGLIPSFSSHPEILTPILEALGSTPKLIIGVANNHSLDAGAHGLEATISAVRAAGGIPIGAATATGATTAVVDVGSHRLGFAALTGHLNRPRQTRGTAVTLDVCPGLPNPRSTPGPRLVEERLGELQDRGATASVLSLHWGFEYERLPDPRQLALARRFVDAGADVIAGHHSHVVQPIELLHNSAASTDAVVAYSLGNFVSRMQRSDWSLGLALDVRIASTPTRRSAVVGYEAVPLFIRRGPRHVDVDLLDPQRLAETVEPEARALLHAVADWWALTRRGCSYDAALPVRKERAAQIHSEVIAR